MDVSHCHNILIVLKKQYSVLHCSQAAGGRGHIAKAGPVQSAACALPNNFALHGSAGEAAVAFGCAAVV